jgi:hypothetical protein
MLMSVSIQRRCIAIAVFEDLKLEHMEVRQLSNNPLQASTAVHRLIQRLLAVHPVTLAVLEVMPGPDTTRRADLARLAHHLLADRGIRVLTVDPTTLRHAFSIPACRTRKALRGIVASWWPALLPRFNTTTVLDAAALGLYSQIQSYFNQ